MFVVGEDFGEVKKVKKYVLIVVIEIFNLFREVVLEWYKMKLFKWFEGYVLDIIEVFEKDIFLYIGYWFIVDIKFLELFEVLRLIEVRGVMEKVKKVC